MTLPKTACRNCGAPNTAMVTRRREDPTRWALDTDLAKEYPEAWREPVRVVVSHGLCRHCAGAKVKLASDNVAKSDTPNP